jgi:hypothetical protein
MAATPASVLDEVGALPVSQRQPGGAFARGAG